MCECLSLKIFHFRQEIFSCEVLQWSSISPFQELRKLDLHWKYSLAYWSSLSIYSNVMIKKNKLHDVLQDMSYITATQYGDVYCAMSFHIIVDASFNFLLHLKISLLRLHFLPCQLTWYWMMNLYGNIDFLTQVETWGIGNK